jgi:hypothetical protein
MPALLGGAAPGAGILAWTPVGRWLHPLHRVLRPRHPLPVLPAVQIAVRAWGHRHAAGYRRPRLPDLELQRLPCAELGRPPDAWIQLPAPVAEGILSL